MPRHVIYIAYRISDVSFSGLASYDSAGAAWECGGGGGLQGVELDVSD